METAVLRARKPRINYALAATLLTQGVSFEDIAPQVGAKSGNVLRVQMHKKGVTATIAKSHHHLEGDVSRPLVLRVANAASEALREQFSGILAAHGQALSKIKPKRNLKHIKQVGEAFEPLARVAKIVHDWGNTQTVGLIAMGTSAQVESQADPPAIELPAAPVPPTDNGPVA